MTYRTPGPYGDRYRHRMLAGIGLILAAFVVVLGIASDATDRIDPLTFDRVPAPQPHCVEDEVLMRVEANAYTYTDGDLVCVHIDRLNGTEQEQ